jgi:hypothetical protein
LQWYPKLSLHNPSLSLFSSIEVLRTPTPINSVDGLASPCNIPTVRLQEIAILEVGNMISTTRKIFASTRDDIDISPEQISATDLVNTASTSADFFASVSRVTNAQSQSVIFKGYGMTRFSTSTHDHATQDLRRLTGAPTGYYLGPFGQGVTPKASSSIRWVPKEM